MMFSNDIINIIYNTNFLKYLLMSLKYSLGKYVVGRFSAIYFGANTFVTKIDYLSRKIFITKFGF